MEKVDWNLKLHVAIDKVVYRILKFMEAFATCMLLSGLFIKVCILDFFEALLTVREKVLMPYQDTVICRCSY